MEQLTALGTGYAVATKCYTTCFTISDGQEHFMIDTGGGSGVLTNLEKLGISVNQVHHIFLSDSPHRPRAGRCSDAARMIGSRRDTARQLSGHAASVLPSGHCRRPARTTPIYAAGQIIAAVWRTHPLLIVWPTGSPLIF